MLPFLATADDLEEWAMRFAARSDLPNLMRHLILASIPGLSQIDMPTGRGIGYAGVDGLVTTPQGNAFVPDGLSVWEMGIEPRPGSKANSDYANRSAHPGDITPAQATFVFVTPHRWAGKRQWVQKKRREGLWRDVRALDADDIALWFGLALPAHLWFSALIGKNPTDLQDVLGWWQDWCAASHPALTANLLVGGRTAAVTAIEQYLGEVPRAALTVQAGSSEEAQAFIAASLIFMISKVPESTAARALVVATPQGWQQSCVSGSPLILVPTFGKPSLAQAIHRSHHVLIPVGPEIVATPEMLVLPRPSRQALGHALEEMGIARHRAETLAATGHRSLLSLRRALSPNREVQQPPWATDPQALCLLVSLLAGGWDEAKEGDQQAIAHLANTPYGQIVAALQHYLTISDAPIRSEDTLWTISSHEDAWQLLGHGLSRADFERFRALVFTVFGSLNPALELPAEQQWMANILGHDRPHSARLRAGLAETLVLMAIHLRERSPVGGRPMQESVAILVDEVYTQTNADETGRMWCSLDDVHPLLAEAEPDAFLAALERACAGDTPLIRHLFMPPQPSSSVARTYQHGVLWALERLVWSPEHMSRAILALARLTQLTPSDIQGNHPGQSLRAVFLLWYPQTIATSAQRLQMLDLLRERIPDVAWNLMRAIIPSFQEAAMSIDRPRWREWREEEASLPLGMSEIWNALTELVPRLIEDASGRTERLGELVALIEKLPPPLRQALFTHFDTLNHDQFMGNTVPLWAQIREVVATHRRFAHAPWAMPAEDVDRLARFYARLTPPDLITQVAWLFTEIPPLLDAVADEDLAAYHARVARAQAEALTRVLCEVGEGGISTLARAVGNAYLLGILLGSELRSERITDEILPYLGSVEEPLRQLARGYLASTFRQAGWEWAQSHLAHRALNTPEQRADFFLGLPATAQTWDLLNDEDEEVQRLYWEQVRLRLEDTNDCLRAVAHLLEHARVWAALDLLAGHLAEVEPPQERVLEVLEAAMHAPPSTPLDHALQEDVAQLLDYLGQLPTYDEARLGHCEWGFVLLFGHRHRPLKVLHAHLAQEPHFFVELVTLCYRTASTDAAREDEQGILRAKAARAVLTSARIIPGTQSDGTIDAQQLYTWTNTARQLFSEQQSFTRGERQIGAFLGKAPRDADGHWPHRAIRHLIEETVSAPFLQGIIRTEHDARHEGAGWSLGAADRARQQARHYRADAQALQVRWPRTAALLRQLEQEFEGEAQWHERIAQQDE